MTDNDPDYSSSDESDVEDNKEDLERLLILENDKKLKVLATSFPQTEVPNVYGRCYFNRPLASNQEDVDDTEDRIAVLEDVMHLRVAVSFYIHSKATTSMINYTTKARCFFSRPSAVE